MKIENLNIRELTESIISSGFPMLKEYDEREVSWQIENLQYWLEHDMLKIKEIFDRKDCSQENWVGESEKGCVVCGKEPARAMRKFGGARFCSLHAHHMERYGYILALTRNSPNTIFLDESGEFAWMILRNKNAEETARAKISCEDILMLSEYKFHFHNGYARCPSIRKNLHQLLIKGETVDHINRDRLDNRRENLRPATRLQNIRNKTKTKGVGKILGVSWSKEKKKWKSYITVGYNQISLGYFKNEEDAIVSRLNAEVKYFQDFAPQNELAKTYGIKNPHIKDDEGRKFNLGQALKHFDRACKLADNPSCSGHCNFLSGVLVSFDVTGTVKWWTQCQRYHFIQIVSSMSTMHRLVSMLKEDKAQFHPSVDPRIIEILKDMLKQERPFEELVYSCPMGIELTARVSTNYLQLKTIYRQRKDHRLQEWRDFCDFMKRNLPYSFLFAKD